METVSVTPPIDFLWAREMCFEATEMQFLWHQAALIRATDCIVGKRDDPYMVMKPGPGLGRPQNP